MPDAIPYVTSYYNKDWGFFYLKKKRRSSRWKISKSADSKFKGHLEVAEAVLLENQKRNFFSSYIAIFNGK